jgi:hypothetical protein
MKKVFLKTFLIIGILSFIFPLASHAQGVEGSWRGVLKIQNVELRIVFNITQRDSVYTATMDSPDQGVRGIPVQTVTFTNNVALKIIHPPFMMEYNGVYMGDKIIGTFNQAGMSIPLNLTSTPDEGPKRPQEPKEPFPYKQEEVLIINKTDSIVLSGTYSYPNESKRHTAVVLISGSGPQDRNAEIMEHKYFLVLSDFLTRNGIAVLRFDERGIGKSGGKFLNATTVDFARDVKAAVEYLRGRSDVDKIGLIGHSEGGIIAPMVASECDNVSFIVLMAGPGISGREIILAQQELIALASGVPAEEVKRSVEINRSILNKVTSDKDPAIIEAELYELIKNIAGKEAAESEIKRQIAQVTTPWMRYFLNHEPAEVLKKVKCPVLAINGTKDLQVPSKINLNAIFEALTGEKRDENNFVTRYNNIVTTIEFEGLNHLFQSCSTGLPSEYRNIEETINPVVLRTIFEWINEL